MTDWILWLYLVNATLLINHEIDSAYWKEWELFGLPGGMPLFLGLHLPLVLLILWGAVQTAQGAAAGLVLSLVLAGGGLFAFAIHTYFIRKGRPQFRSASSILLLAALVPVSIAQAMAVILHWAG